MPSCYMRAGCEGRYCYVNDSARLEDNGIRPLSTLQRHSSLSTAAVHNRRSGPRVGSEPLTGQRACSRATIRGSAADSTAWTPSSRSWQTDWHPAGHRLSGVVEIALQVFTYSVAAAKGALDLV